MRPALNYVARSIFGMQQRLGKILVAQAKAEGPESEEIIPGLDITCDHRNEKLNVKVTCDRKIIWERNFACTRAVIEWEPIEHFNREVEKVSDAMRGTLSLIGAKYNLWLSQKFPDHIHNVEVRWNSEEHFRIVIVHFKNGYKLEAPENEIKTDLFVAKCIMVYDLPTI